MIHTKSDSSTFLKTRLEIQRWLGRSTILIALFVLTACETTPPPKNTSLATPPDWEFRQTRLTEFRHWKIQGKLAVIQPDRSDNLLINQWQQSLDNFDIRISSVLLGLGATQIAGTPDYLTLHQPDEPTLYSANPEALLEEALGWTLPLKSLRYWIKGIPAPDSPVAIEFDEQGNPHRIQQTQWLVTLDRYKPFGELVLPGKITLTRNDIRLKVVITEWAEINAQQDLNY